MPVEEALIRRLLADTSVENFDTNIVFRSTVLNDPGAAEILVGIMRAQGGQIRKRARRMLCFFDEPALPALDRGLTLQGSLWRSDLLHIVWTIVSGYDPNELPRLLGLLAPRLVSLFDDKSLVVPEYSMPIEIEYRYRVCDEAYVLCQNMLHPEFDDTTLREETMEERDAAIRILRGRLERGNA